MVPDQWFEACAAGTGMNEREYIAAILLATVLRYVGNAKSNLAVPDGLLRSVPEKIREALSGN